MLRLCGGPDDARAEGCSLRALQISFELMELGARVKLALVARAPYPMEYSMRVYFRGRGGRLKTA